MNRLARTTHRVSVAPGRAIVAEVGYLLGGGALFGSAFLRWVASGPGSGLRGHKLIDAIVALHGQVAALSSGRLTILWYLVPASGAASWVACGLAGPHGRPARLIATGALVMTLVTAAAFVRLVGFARLGWGPNVAVGGAIVLCIAAGIPGRRRLRGRSLRCGP